MASGGKRGSGERVLESRHVIGLFMLMLLFSGLFFTLGYVMGRNQYDGQVRAAMNPKNFGDSEVSPKPQPVSKKQKDSSPAEPSADPATPPNSDWEFYNAGKPKQTEDRLKPVESAPAPVQKVSPKLVNTAAPAKNSAAPSKTQNAPTIPGGSYMLQVAALTKEADAFDLAKRLQKEKIPAFVLSPQGDKYFRVQVGPYPDQKSAEAARKGLDAAGFKAIVKH
jgi:DedD protein